MKVLVALLALASWAFIASADECTSIKVDQRQECGDATTTETECVAKSCCWEIKPGAPKCFLKEGATDDPNPTTAVTKDPGTTVDPPTTAPPGTGPTTTGPPADKCENIRVDDRKDCGDATTTEDDCLAKSCCWEIKPGAPKCYLKSGQTVTEDPNPPTKPTTTTRDPNETTTTQAPTTEQPTTGHPAEKCEDIKNDEKIDCAQNEPDWTIAGCLAKGCCHLDVGKEFPACFYNFSHTHDKVCESITVRTDCGDASTTEYSCLAKGCCWEMKPGSPFCFYKRTYPMSFPEERPVPRFALFSLGTPEKHN